MCLRTTWRAETISEVKVKNVKFKMIDNKRYAVVDICKSKTNQMGEIFTYFIDPIEDKQFCIVTLLSEYILLVFGKNWNNKDEFLFQEEGKKLNSTIISNIIKRMAERAEEKLKLSSKSLRVGAVTWMLEAGFSIENLKALGWTETSTAFNCYIRNTALAMQGGTKKMLKQDL